MSNRKASLMMFLSAASLLTSAVLSTAAQADADFWNGEPAPAPRVIVRGPAPGQGYGPGGPGYGPRPGFGPGGPSYGPGPGGPRPGPGYDPGPGRPVVVHPPGGPFGQLPPGAPIGGRRPPVVVVGSRIPGQCYTPPPRRDDDDDEVEVTRVLAQVMRGRSCDRAGDVLREMANSLMSSAELASPARPIPAGGPRPVIVRQGEDPREARERWRGHLNRPRFFQIVWERLAEMYRDCNRGCFDDGVAVGQISATGYCAASIAVNGLDAPGLETQKPLPLCQNETFTGCLVGYDQTSSTTQGCAVYKTGNFARVYDESKSQDCHMD